MLHIAICDDNTIALESTDLLIQQWFSQKGYAVKIFCTTNGDELIHLHQTTPMDLIFLDIMMPLISGMDTAKELRTRDKTVPIVFLTSSREFALGSYSVRASGYLLKPPSIDSLDEILEDLITAPMNSSYLVLKTNGGYQRINLNDIEFLEAQNKQVNFHLITGLSVLTYDSIHNLEEKLLLEDGFFKCHRSYIISFAQVDSFTAREVKMKSGTLIPIARGFSKLFHDSYFTYMFDH